jgi:2-oxoisovalerate dehydrogenase E1 component
MFAHGIGWRLAFPSNAQDAVGLLRSAMRGNDPVIFFEHRNLLDNAWARRPYPGDEFMVPFGKAVTLQNGTDATIVAWGAMVERAQEAATLIGDKVEVLDLRTISPWDRKGVFNSVRKTRRLLIVHEDGLTAGFGAEIAAQVADELFMELDAPIRRLAVADIPIPHNIGLMEATVPTTSKIVAAVEELLRF